MKNESYFIKGFPDYRLVRLSESKFCVMSNKKGYWKEIGSEDEAGHISILLLGNGVKRKTYVHVIIAEMFVPNPEGKNAVHHIDGDATNNNPSNLMWVTNSQHRTIHNEMFNPMKGKHHTEEQRKKIGEKIRAMRLGELNPFFGKHHSEEARRKMSEKRQKKPVIQYTLGCEFLAEYPSVLDAVRQTGIGHRSISRCCKGKYKTAGGFIWRYAS